MKLLSRQFNFHKLRIHQSWSHEGNRNKRILSLFAGYFWFFRTKISKKSKIVSVFEDMKFKCFPDSAHALSYFFNGTEYDNWHIMKFIDKILMPGDRFIDIGANVGLISLLAASKVGANGSIISVEPMSENVAKLSENIMLNNLKNVDILQIGLSDLPGEFNFSKEDVGSHMTDVSDYNTEVIKVLQLDTVLQNQTEAYNVTKIDVEGMELLILKGAEESIKKNLLPVIIIEVNGLHERFGILRGDISDFLIKRNYIFGRYNHDYKTLYLDSQLHEDTIAINKDYLEIISARYKELKITYK
jgi:FkbM family methyltransferase